ncbi:MAG: hypothetical protein IJ542_02835 [Clostridia bacterium]|nr:hypothetical protein [Clostridia bacterium]
MLNELTKKRKINYKNIKNDIKTDKISQNFAKSESFSEQDFELLSIIKALLSTRRFLPNIISLLSRLVVDYASDTNRGSYIFGDIQNGTYSQIDEILKLEQRQRSLLNMQFIVDTLTNSLSEKYFGFVELRYFKNKKFPLVAEELGVDERTLYRWNKTILIKLMKFCKLNNWGLSFFKAQLHDEKWILPHYQKSYESVLKLFG